MLRLSALRISKISLLPGNRNSIEITIESPDLRRLPVRISLGSLIRRRVIQAIRPYQKTLRFPESRLELHNVSEIPESLNLLLRKRKDTRLIMTVHIENLTIVSPDDHPLSTGIILVNDSVSISLRLSDNIIHTIDRNGIFILVVPHHTEIRKRLSEITQMDGIVHITRNIPLLVLAINDNICRIHRSIDKRLHTIRIDIPLAVIPLRNGRRRRLDILRKIKIHLQLIHDRTRQILEIRIRCSRILVNDRNPSRDIANHIIIRIETDPRPGLHCNLILGNRLKQLKTLSISRNRIINPTSTRTGLRHMDRLTIIDITRHEKTIVHRIYRLLLTRIYSREKILPGQVRIRRIQNPLIRNAVLGGHRIGDAINIHIPRNRLNTGNIRRLVITGRRITVSIELQVTLRKSLETHKHTDLVEHVHTEVMDSNLIGIIRVPALDHHPIKLPRQHIERQRYSLPVTCGGRNRLLRASGEND